MQLEHMKSEVEEIDTEEFEEDTVEEDLTTSLDLLRECRRLMEAMIDPMLKRRITLYMEEEITKTAEEVNAFLNQFQDPELEEEGEV